MYYGCRIQGLWIRDVGLIICDLKPAVNRQPLFPRGGPEELAEQHNATTQSECEDNCRKHRVVSHKQQVSFRTQCFSFLCTVLVFAYTDAFARWPSRTTSQHPQTCINKMFPNVTCAARAMTSMT